MSKGALIFALNTGNVDYVRMAIFCAKRVIEHLGIPVSIVTDSRQWLETEYPDDAKIFDNIIDIKAETNQLKRFYDGSLASSVLPWKNTSRNHAFNLTPYETTLVLDSDYIINSSVLRHAFDRDEEFQIYSNSTDLAEWRDTMFNEFEYINQHSVKFYWATVMVFKKTKTVEALFDLVAYIKYNWDYFRFLYKIEAPLFRNDFAFSIAIHIMNGHTAGTFACPLPGNMIFCVDRDVLTRIVDTNMQFLVEKENYSGEYTFVTTHGIDVHVMNKRSLIRVMEELGE